MSYELKYLERFKKLENVDQSVFRLNGARILLEMLPQKEIKTASGLVLSAPKDLSKFSADSQRAALGVVLLTGSGYLDNDGNPIDVDVKVGNVVLVNDLAMRSYSSFPGIEDYVNNSIAMTSEADIQMVFPDMAAFEAYEKLLANQN